MPSASPKRAKRARKFLRKSNSILSRERAWPQAVSARVRPNACHCWHSLAEDAGSVCVEPPPICSIYLSQAASGESTRLALSLLLVALCALIALAIRAASLPTPVTVADVIE